MTGPFHLSIRRTKAGRYKVYVVGHADGHIIDWAGCNFRCTPVGHRQPFRGFDTLSDAVALQKEIESEPILREIEERGARAVGGTFLGNDNRHVEVCRHCQIEEAVGTLGANKPVSFMELAHCPKCWEIVQRENRNG